MRKTLHIICLLIYSTICYSQEITGYQKLRGDIISSQSNDNYNTHKYFAFDTDENTCFRAANLGGWIGLDLKQRYVIRKVRLYPRKDKPERLVGAKIQGANNADFSDAQNLFTIVDMPSPYHYTIYTLNIASSYRYVRCYCENTYCNIADIEFYTNPDSQIREYKQLTNLPAIYLETGGYFNFEDKSVYAENSTVYVSRDNEVNSYAASIKGRGNSTWDYITKKSFRIKFDKKQHFLGLPAKAKNWTLIASHVDKTFLRNGLTFEMAKHLEFEFVPSCVYVDVFLDGFYYGTYFVSDHIDVRENRIDIDEMTPADNQLPEISGGYHLEVDGYANLEPVFFTTPRGVNVTIKSPDDDVITDNQKNYISNHVSNMETLLYSNPERACSEFIDIKSAVSYYLISEITGNCDSFWCFHCYKKRNDDKLYFGPVWDFDQAYLNDSRMNLEKSILDVDFGFKQWFPRIMDTQVAKDELKRQWKSIIDNGVESIMNNYIDDNAQLIYDSQILNYERWNSLDKYIFTNIFVTNTYEGYIDYLKDYLERRFVWVDNYVNFLCADKVVILPTSENPSDRYTWKTTTNTPASDWYSESFNDDSWASQLAPFGTINVCTSWTTSDIYIRRKFVVSEDVIDNLQTLILSIFHDEDSEIYINGTLAASYQNYLVNYNKYVIDKSLLKAGENTIAIHCHQTLGGQYIDAGLLGTLNPSTSISDNKTERIDFHINGNTLYVNNIPDRSVINIYSLNGILVYTNLNCGTSLTKDLPYPGIYIMDVNGQKIKFMADF